MTETRTVLLPIRDFSGFTRLQAVLADAERSHLARLLAQRGLDAARDAALHPVIVSSDRDVTEWAGEREVPVVPDASGGLSTAMAEAVDRLGDTPWMVLHADIPLVSGEALAQVHRVATHGPVLVPSHDGGTNAIASRGPFPFAYGEGSFHRHLAVDPAAAVLPLPALAIDIDSQAQLAIFLDLLTPIKAIA